MEAFLDEFCAKLGRERLELSGDAMSALTTRDYPGNVRELRNLAHRLSILAPGPVVDAGDLGTILGDEGVTGARGTLAAELEALERRLIREAVQAAQGVHHGVEHLWVHRGGGVVVEVDLGHDLRRACRSRAAAGSSAAGPACGPG